MGVFGTSQEEENQLREVAIAGRNDPARQSSSSVSQSAYDTAPEDEVQSFGSDVTETYKPQDEAANHTQQDDLTLNEHMADYEHDHIMNIQDSAVDEPKELVDGEDLTEEGLNRRYSLLRMASNRSMDATEAFEEFQRQSTRGSKVSSVNGEKVIAKEDLEFDDENDKDNPHNYPRWKKWSITLVVAIVCLCCSLGSSLYVSGATEITQKFHVSQELVISGLTFYILGLAFGPLMTAPLSEMVGRRVIYVVSFPIAMLFAMGVGLAKNIRTILVLRFFTGYFASPALSIAGGTISDVWANEPMDLSFSIALFCLAPFMGPIIGPIIGGFAAEHKDYKWAASWVLLMFMGAILPFLLLVPETYKPIILRRRAKKRGYKVIEPKVDAAALKAMATFVLLKPLEMLVMEPIVMFMSVYIAFIFAVLFGFFEAFPIIFRGVYHMDLGVSGLPFIGVGLGLICGVLFYLCLDRFYYYRKNPDGTRGKRDENGNPILDPPELKLLLGKIGAICLPISLFWLGWTGRSSVHWMAPTAAGFPFGFGLILVFFSVVLYFSMAFPPINVASAMAANNLLRYILASVFPLFTVQMYERLHIDWATSLFAFIALAMVPVPFVFEKIGKKMRARSKYGYAAYFKKLAEEKKAREQKNLASSSETKAENDSVNAPEEVVSNRV